MGKRGQPAMWWENGGGGWGTARYGPAMAYKVGRSGHWWVVKGAGKGFVLWMRREEMDREGDFFDVLGIAVFEMRANGGNKAIFQAYFNFWLLSNAIYKYLFTILYCIQNGLIKNILNRIH